MGKKLLDVSSYLNRLDKIPRTLTNKEYAKLMDMKKEALGWLVAAIKDKGIDPDSLIFNLDVREIIPLDQYHTSVVISVRPKGYVHVPVKNRPYDSGFITLVTRVVGIDEAASWVDRHVDRLCAALVDPVGWTKSDVNDCTYPTM